MGESLYIGIPYVKTSEDGTKARLCAEVRINDGDSQTLWYEADSEYSKYLCYERSDAFVVNLLYYAMEKKMDIVCEQEMTERLHYQLVEYLIPCVSKNIEKYHEISIKAPLTNEKLPSENAVGASLSGGVDSFYALFKHINREEKNYNITHLTFFNAGASGDYGGEKARARYLARIDWIKGVADLLEKKFVCVDTNMNEFLMQIHVKTHVFRTLAIPLAMQKLFSIYYFASSRPFDTFAYSEKEPTHYDILSLQCLSMNNITFYSSGGEVTRLEKTRFISEQPVTYSRLNVCIEDDINCSKCEKCKRTMMALYALGKLDKYEKVFDLDYFNKRRFNYLCDVVASKRNHDWPEIYDILKQKGELTLRVRLRGTLIYWYCSLHTKMSKRKNKGKNI